MLVDTKRYKKMCLYPIIVKGNTFPCGKCIECKIKKSNEWAFRIMLESKQYDDNMFLTLTYNEEHLPGKGNLSRRDLTLFLKRLRKKIGKFRYFACGEYGVKGQRPHYHLIIFGKKFDDMKYFCCDNKKQKLFRSKTLESLWHLGFSTCGELTMDSAKYCAKYMQKVNDLKADKKPFITMSLKPGIGADAVHIDMLKTDKIYLNGKYITTPRYFLKVLEKVVPSYVESVKANRRKRVMESVISVEWEDDILQRRKKYQKKFGYAIDKRENK